MSTKALPPPISPRFDADVTDLLAWISESSRLLPHVHADEMRHLQVLIAGGYVRVMDLRGDPGSPIRPHDVVYTLTSAGREALEARRLRAAQRQRRNAVGQPAQRPPVRPCDGPHAALGLDPARPPQSAGPRP